MTDGIHYSLKELIALRAKKPNAFAPQGQVKTHLLGSHRALFKGRGMAFAESRPYQIGDDVRHIDWRISARLGKTHTKLFEEERERPILILLDNRRMMYFGSRVRYKSHLAAEIASRLAWTAFDGGDRLGALLLKDQQIIAFRPTRTRQSVLRFLNAVSNNLGVYQAVAAPQSDSNINTAPIHLATALKRLRQLAPTGALLFIISDFHDFDERAKHELSALSLTQHITLLSVFDQLEAKLPNAPHLLVRDAYDETQVAALGDLSAAINRYEKDFAARQQALLAFAQNKGMAFSSIHTEADVERALHFRHPKNTLGAQSISLATPHAIATTQSKSNWFSRYLGGKK